MHNLFNKKQSLKLNGKLMNFSSAKVMAILNITPDSFFDGGNYTHEELIFQHLEKITRAGADIIDIGAYSSRPGADNIPVAEEIKRLDLALSSIKKRNCELPLSIDTFRSEVAEWALKTYQVEIINDISAGDLDDNMFNIIAKYQPAYLMMHMRGNPQTMSSLTQYKDLTAEILRYFSEKITHLKNIGVNDLIVDPGFGFAKTLEQNYQLLSQLHLFEALETPLLTGLSRKSMIYKLLEGSPEDSLNGTTALNMLALTKGADILRVHDVREAKECITLFNAIK